MPLIRWVFRSANVMELNQILRQQLDQAHVINQKLSDDLKRSTHELQQVRDELSQKTREWKDEERVSP